MIKRSLKKEILKRAEYRAVIFITGPRQCGKTTLARECFPHYHYVNLDHEPTLLKILENIDAFLDEMQKMPGVIIDEFQYAPKITSYIKVRLDKLIGIAEPKPGFYILIGSQNFLMMEQVTQTLVGRATGIKMLPLSLAEAAPTDSLEEVLYRGLYPWPYEHAKDLNKVREWAVDYVEYYLERDAKTLSKNINSILFRKFLKLLAGRVGNVLNVNSLAIDCGIEVKVVYEWLNILETCFIIIQVAPFYENFSRQLIKAPKVYFVDTGVVCSLLGITSPSEVTTHQLYGSIFENMIMLELIKSRRNRGWADNIYFWREDRGLEVDAVLQYGNYLRAVEIKAAKAIKSSLANGITQWKEAVKNNTDVRRFVIYGGEEDQEIDGVQWVSWRRCETVNFADQEQVTIEKTE